MWEVEFDEHSHGIQWETVSVLDQTDGAYLTPIYMYILSCGYTVHMLTFKLAIIYYT